VGKPSTTGHPSRPLQPFILSGLVLSSKLQSDVSYHYGWRHLVKATEVTTGLVESNGSLPPGRWLKITCGLTAYTPGSAPGQMLGNEYGKTIPF